MGFGYKVYFTERAKNRVICWDPDVGTTAVFAGGSAAATPAEELRDPYGLAVDAQGHVLIADKMNNRLLRHAGRLQVVPVTTRRPSVGRQGPVIVRRDRNDPDEGAVAMLPTTLFMESTGVLLVSSSELYGIFRLNTAGEFVRILGKAPDPVLVHEGVIPQIPPGRVLQEPLDQPISAISRADGTIYFIERGYGLVRCYHPAMGIRSLFPVALRQKFHQAMIVADSYPMTDYHPGFPSSLVFDRQGTLYLCDALHHCVWQVDIAANMVRCVIRSEAKSLDRSNGGPAVLAFGPDGTAWLFDYADGSVQAYRPIPQGLWRPIGVRCAVIDREHLACRSLQGAGLLCA